MSRSDEIHYAVESVHQIHAHECLCGFSSPVSRDRTKHIVAAVLAETEPRTITTAEELDGLPNGSVIRTAGTDEYEPRVAVKLSNWNGSAEWDVADCEELSVMTGELDDLPATVLLEPR